MPDWVRRSYEAVGVTQVPPGPHLCALQEPHLGKVLLCLDVSGSMASAGSGRRSRLEHAAAGAERFITEAVAARYKIGLVLWNHGVQRFVPLSRDPAMALGALRGATASGATEVDPALRLGIRELGPLRGDRVMAIFGDGDIGRIEPAVASSARAASLGIRIIVRGLGEVAAAQLALIATELEEEIEVGTAAGIESGIASMAASITVRRPRRDPRG